MFWVVQDGPGSWESLSKELWVKAPSKLSEQVIQDLKLNETTVRVIFLCSPGKIKNMQCAKLNPEFCIGEKLCPHISTRYQVPIIISYFYLQA